MNRFEKGEKVICRNVEAVVISYDKKLGYYKCKRSNGVKVPFVSHNEIRKVDSK